MSPGKGQTKVSYGPIVRCGHLRKIGSFMATWTPRRKYFVLRADAPGYPACLEYYDSKKKFEQQLPPKRSISMRSCYNINRRHDSRHKHVIVLYTKDDCFSIALETERELGQWLSDMLLLFGDVPDCPQPKRTFEHVWTVEAEKRGLCLSRNMIGSYNVCLTNKTVAIMKVSPEGTVTEHYEHEFGTVRRCGTMERILYLEVGRLAVGGSGEYWFKAEDVNISQNIHDTIMSALTGSAHKDKDDVVPQSRKRSSSANEASKPISFTRRRPTGSKAYGISPVGATIRDRCDSLPTRARTTSDSQPINPVFHPRNAHLSSHPNRPHSMCGRGMSYSPPVSSMPISPASGACSTDSAGSSLSVDDTVDTVDEPVARFSHSLTPEEPVILEENSDEYGPWSADHATLNNHSPNFKSHSPAQPSSYVDMCSPCGSSPRGGGAYVPMSPGGMILCHSRNASLVEEATLPDGYVPMAPRGDDGYVPMEPSKNSPKDIPQLGSLSPVVSGTPSTASRLSEYPLNKVTSYIVPSEDLALRPFRAFSLGSRPDPVNHRHLNRLEITQSDSSRTRAFSVGSKSKIPELGRLSYATITKQSTSNDKSNSAPMLSSSWGHNAATSVHNERMADLMELDFSKNHHTKSISCSPSSRSQSHSYSTAIDTSSYVDMSPGSSGRSVMGNTAPYVDMSGMNKVNRISNGNVGPTTPLSSGAHKPLITTLKPVAEAEGPYMAMEPRRNDWRPMDNSPKQLPSPMQDDYMLMNGPPGVARTAPVDFPQPRQPPEGYVEMVPFNARPALEQDYMNMAMGNTRSRHLQRSSSRKAAGNRSQPIAIKASKPVKTPSFLPLSNSPQSQSLATPTSSTTIFPFSLNSPQSPARSFETPKQTPDSSYSDCSPDVSNYAAMTPISGIPAPIAMSESPQPLSPVRPPPLKTLASNVPQNTQIPTSSSNNLKLVTSSTSKPQNPANSGDNSKISNANSSNLPGNSETLPNKVDVAENSTCTSQNSTVSSSEPQSSTVGTSEIPASPLKKRLPDNVEKKKKPTNRNTTSPVTVSVKNEASPSSKHKIEKSSSEGSRESAAKDPPQSPITKKFRELSVSSSKLVNSSPNTSPTPTGTLKAKSTSPKVTDEGSTSGTPTPTPTSLDSEGYETLQPGAGCILLNYASLDLPESSSIPPVSPTPAQEAFRYAQIDFAKLKQN